MSKKLNMIANLVAARHTKAKKPPEGSPEEEANESPEEAAAEGDMPTQPNSDASLGPNGKIAKKANFKKKVL